MKVVGVNRNVSKRPQTESSPYRPYQLSLNFLPVSLANIIIIMSLLHYTTDRELLPGATVVPYVF